MSDEPSSAWPDHDPSDDYVWEEQPGLGLVPVARRDSGFSSAASVAASVAHASDQVAAAPARFDSFMDEEDRWYDPLYAQARQDRDDLMAQSMEPAPEHYMPIDLVAKAHAKRGAFDPTGNFQDVKLSDSELLPLGATVKKRKIKRFRNGDVETTEDDGSKKLVRADGTIVKTSVDGTVTEETPDEKVAREKEDERCDNLLRMARNLGSYRMVANLLSRPGDAPLFLQVLNQNCTETVRRFRRRLAGASPPSNRFRGRLAGASLPSNRARREAEASDAVREEHPDVLMFGGFNVLPDMQRELGQLARKGEMNMQPGSEQLLHDERTLEAPAYLKHFAGDRLGADWSAEHPDDLLEQEDREWKAEQKRRRLEEREKGDTRTETEKLVAKYKACKNMDITGEIMEEDAPQQLAKMQENERELEAIRAELARREKEEARREEEEFEKQLMEAMDAMETKEEAKEGAKEEPNEEPEGEPEEDATDGYDSDIENRVYPDPVPPYLLDRREYYILKPKAKPHSHARQQPALGERPANSLAVNNPVYAWPRFGPAADADSDSDCEIVDAPPDEADRMVEA